MSLLALATPVGVSAQTAVSVHSATVGTEPLNIVYNADALRPFVQAAQTRRVDIAGIGDSNQVAGPNQDYGWDHGYSKAWTDRYGEYSTGVFGMRGDGGWAGPQGYINHWGHPYGAVSTGAPAELNKYKLFTDSNNDFINDFPPSYAYLGPTFIEPANQWTPVVTIEKASSLFGQNLRWHMSYGTFENGDGSFTPSVSSFGARLYEGPKVSTSTGTTRLVDGAFKIPAAAYSAAPGPAMSFGLSFPADGTMRGPFFGLYQRVEGERETGVSYSTMLWQGGRALVHAATSLQQQSDDALKEYVRNLVKLQGDDKLLLVHVQHGQNDPGHKIPSVGPSPAPSDTPAGFADNMDALITRMRAIWTSMGYEPTNLIFQYGPYHTAEGDADDGTGRTKVERLSDYEEAIVGLSQQHPEFNLAVVRGTQLITPEQMNANGWYESETDHVHLNMEGYIGLSELAVQQVVSYATADQLGDRSSVTSLSFQFDSDVSEHLSPDDLMLRDATGDLLLDPFDLAVGWDPKTLTATWTFPGLPLGELPVGEYEAILKMSQFGSGSESPADYVYLFTAPPIPEPSATLGMIIAGAAMARRRR